MNFVSEVLSIGRRLLGMTTTQTPVQVQNMRGVQGHKTHALSPSSSLTVSRKRKLEDSGDSATPEKREYFPLFASPSISPGKSSKKSASPASPSRKKFNSTLKQGASQSNKIFKYLKPKRLLSNFNSAEVNASVPPRPVLESDKENGRVDLRVTLVRLDDDIIFNDHNYCVVHQSPKKLCCDVAAEYVVSNLESYLYKERQNPCSRLGVVEPSCIRPEGCKHEQTSMTSSGFQETVLNTMVDIDLKVMMIRACCQDLSPKTYPSPTLIHTVFQIMKQSPDKTVIALGHSFLKRTLRVHPPCNGKMKSHYTHVLNSSESQVKIPSGLWSLRSMDFFESSLSELESHIEALLNPSQLKEKLKLPGVRVVRKPKRFRDSPSPKKRSRQISYSEVTENFRSQFENFSGEALKEKQAIQEAFLKLSTEEKTDYVFSRFEILVDILEWDLIVWLSKNSDFSKIRDRVSCPLVVLALWRPGTDTGFDSAHCRRVFAMYVSSWVLKFHARHLRTLARLIGLIAEVTSASELNPGIKYPFIGEGCENLARKLSAAFENTELGESRSKAIAMIKPEWLKMLVSAKFLHITPSISSLDAKILLEQSKTDDAAEHLWASFLHAVMQSFYVSHTMSLLQEASNGRFHEDIGQSYEPEVNINYEAILKEVHAFMDLRTQMRNLNGVSSTPTILRQFFAI